MSRRNHPHIEFSDLVAYKVTEVDDHRPKRLKTATPGPHSSPSKNRSRRRRATDFRPRALTPLEKLPEELLEKVLILSFNPDLPLVSRTLLAKLSNKPSLCRDVTIAALFYSGKYDSAVQSRVLHKNFFTAEHWAAVKEFQHRNHMVVSAPPFRLAEFALLPDRALSSPWMGSAEFIRELLDLGAKFEQYGNAGEYAERGLTQAIEQSNAHAVDLIFWKQNLVRVEAGPSHLLTMLRCLFQDGIVDGKYTHEGLDENKTLVAEMVIHAASKRWCDLPWRRRQCTSKEKCEDGNHDVWRCEALWDYVHDLSSNTEDNVVKTFCWQLKAWLQWRANVHLDEPLGKPVRSWPYGVLDHLGDCFGYKPRDYLSRVSERRAGGFCPCGRHPERWSP